MTATMVQQSVIMFASLVLCAVCIVVFIRYESSRALAAIWLTVGVNIALLYILGFFLLSDHISAEWVVAWSVATRIHTVGVAIWDVLARAYEAE